MRFQYVIQFDSEIAMKIATGKTVDLSHKVFQCIISLEYADHVEEVLQDMIKNNHYKNIKAINTLEYKFHDDLHFFSMLFDVELFDPENTDEFFDLKRSALRLKHIPMIATFDNYDHELPFSYNEVS